MIMEISEKIFQKLKENQMSQKEFSKLSGIPESTVSDWKKKGNTPKPEKLPDICRVLGISLYELLGAEEPAGDGTVSGYILSDSEKDLIEIYRASDEDQKSRLLKYFERIRSMHGDLPSETDDTEAVGSDTMLLEQKLLARRLRRLARLDRIKLDESEHDGGYNLHLFKYLDYLGIDKLEYIKEYLSHIQPFMLTEMRSQEKFENAVCVLDRFYRISLYIKVDATKNEEIIVSFHENHKNGVAKRSPIEPKSNMVYVFADSIGSHVSGTDKYSVNLFITRGVKTFPINVPAERYDDEGFLVRYEYINNALIDIANGYLEDLYTADTDFSEVSIFSSLQQLSFTCYGNDVFSNISLLTDSILIQKDSVSRQVADAALVIYCNSIDLIEADRKELLDTLKSRYAVNSVMALPGILKRVEENL